MQPMRKGSLEAARTIRHKTPAVTAMAANISPTHSVRRIDMLPVGR
jgi:hypothetical protein